jgi:hypothetical protein
MSPDPAPELAREASSTAPQTAPAWWPLARTGITVRDLNHRACLHLLAGKDTGRMFVTDLGLEAIPISYRIEDAGLVVGPPPHLVDALATPPRLVMVCVDHLEPDRQRGWSLVVVGPLLRHARESADHRQVPSGAGSLAIDLYSLTGRAFTKSPLRRRQLTLTT